MSISNDLYKKAAASLRAIGQEADEALEQALRQAERALLDPAPGKRGYISVERWAAKARARYRAYCKLRALIWGYFDASPYYRFSTTLELRGRLMLRLLDSEYVKACAEVRDHHKNQAFIWANHKLPDLDE